MEKMLINQDYATRREPYLVGKSESHYPISLEFRLDNLEDMVKVSKSHGEPSFIDRFLGYVNFKINGFNILELSPEENEDEWAKPEVVSWLYWLCEEKENYCDPTQYRINGPEEILELEKRLRLEMSEEDENLNEWGDHHVLMRYIEESPYLMLQSPSDNELEIYWNFGLGYIHKKGEIIVVKEKFLEELEKERKKMAEIIFEKIPELKKDYFFKFLL